ncbi:MAG: glycosyltransferase [Candidatus Woesearchaeota archaeon]
MNFGNILIYVISYFGLFTSFFFIITLLKRRKELYSEVCDYFPTVTIAVPAYNEEETLAGTLNSLLALDYPKDKLEIMVIDDGSTDNTLKIARRFEKKGVVVYTKPNTGKGESLNFAIEKSKSEFFGALDADSFAEVDSLTLLMSYFKNPKVMAVTPSMRIHNPKSILQKIQQLEYLFGIFLRKVFAFLGSIHVTPGPLSIYRRSFFDKYGGYDVHNLTEDIELALRIQKHGYLIENSIIANVYTKGPSKFKPLFRQRLRWYKGFLDNVLLYKDLFHKKHGMLGLFILPVSFISVGLVLVSTAYLISIFIRDVYLFIRDVIAVDFRIFDLIHLDFSISMYSINTTFFIGIMTALIGFVMIVLAKVLSRDKSNIWISYIFYLFFYWVLFGVWWGASLYYKALNKKIRWGGKAL